MTWLLVEDDSDIRNVVAMMMSVWGERPLAFPDGGAAWNWLETVANGTYTGQLPELALMDIRMPGYTGDKVAARIRQTPALKDIPIILMTAFSLTDSEIKDMMDQAGIDHMINKPLPDMEQFRATLYQVREDKKARVAARQAVAASAPPAPAASPAPAAAAPAQPAQATPPAAPPTPPAPSAPASAAQPAPAQPARPAVPPTPTQSTPAPTQPAQAQPSSAPASTPVSTTPAPTQPPAQPLTQNAPTPAPSPQPEKKE